MITTRLQSKITAQVVKEIGITVEQAHAILNNIAKLPCAEGDQTFTIPNLGEIHVLHQKPYEAVVNFKVNDVDKKVTFLEDKALIIIHRGLFSELIIGDDRVAGTLLGLPTVAWPDDLAGDIVIGRKRRKKI
jgi:hypothetical protein